MSSFFRDKIYQSGDKIYYLVFGEDVFISYSRSDGDRYAKALFTELTDNQKFTCYMDELGTEPGEEIPASLRRKLKNCSVFVLLGSPHAHQSKAIGDEILTFMSVKKNRTRLIPIDFGGQMRKAVSDKTLAENITWFKTVGGVDVEFEKPEALESGEISKDVIRRITGVRGYVKQTERIRKARNSMLTGLGVFLLLSLGLGIFAAIAVGQAAKAATQLEETKVELVQINKDKEEAEKAKTSALKEAEDAKTAARDAEAKRAEAEIKMDDALKLQEQAEKKTGEARQQAAQAEEKRQIAERLEKEAKEQKAIAEKEATKQGAIAQARQLANESTALLSQNNPALLKQSLEKAVKASNIVERHQLSMTEPISSLRRALAVTPKIIKASSPVRLKSKKSCEDSVFSTNQKSFACRSGSEVLVYDVANPENPPKPFDFTNDLKKSDGNNAPVKARGLSVSDDGRRVAVSIEIQGLNGKKADDELAAFRIAVRDSDGKHYEKSTEDIQNISLSPDGRLLIYSEIHRGANADDKMLLQTWLVGAKLSDVLFTSRAVLKGSFSPDGKYFAATAKNVLTESITHVHVFSTRVSEGGSERRRYLSLGVENISVSTINIPSAAVKGIAVDDSGSTIAIKADGISIWDLNAYPKLKALIPPPSPNVDITSLRFAKALFTFEDSLVIFKDNGASVATESWTITGDEGSRACEDCEQNSTPLWGIRMPGFVEQHKKLEARTTGTQITIFRKKDLTEIDKVDFGEAINQVVFSADGTEIITKSYEPSDLHDISQSAEGREQRNYRKWKIGFQNLNKIAYERLKQF